MLFMLLDHVRETFYLHLQVPDPMVVAETPPGLFFPRMLAHLCAPVFVFLTGLGAYLYASRHAEADQASAASGFLWRRGLFLVLLEVTVVNFAWTFQFPPARIFLQVIWAIGLSMLALSVLVWLPRKALLLLGLVLVAGHNLFDSLHFPPDHVMHIPWAILHDRGWLELAGLQLRTSYPVLPWIGVIALGYGIGPWFGKACDATQRRHHLLVAGVSCLLGFALLRTLNVYGDAPWLAGADALRTVMSWFNVTKYPPSLLFLLRRAHVLLCAASVRAQVHVSGCNGGLGDQPGTTVRAEQFSLAMGDLGAAGRGLVSRRSLVCCTQAASTRHHLAQVPVGAGQGASQGTILPPPASMT